MPNYKAKRQQWAKGSSTPAGYRDTGRYEGYPRRLKRISTYSDEPLPPETSAFYMRKIKEMTKT